MLLLITSTVTNNREKDLIPVPALENGNYNVQYQRLDDEIVASGGKESFYS